MFSIVLIFIFEKLVNILCDKTIECVESFSVEYLLTDIQVLFFLDRAVRLFLQLFCFYFATDRILSHFITILISFFKFKN